MGAQSVVDEKYGVIDYRETSKAGILSIRISLHLLMLSCTPGEFTSNTEVVPTFHTLFL